MLSTIKWHNFNSCNPTSKTKTDPRFVGASRVLVPTGALCNNAFSSTQKLPKGQGD